MNGPTPTITEQRFIALADSFGGDLQRWPHEWRGPAAELLAHSAVARDALQRSTRLDEALHALPTPAPPSDALRRRILATAPQPRRLRWKELLDAAWAEIGGLRYAGPALAASLALGVVMAAELQVDAGEEFEMPAMLLSEAQYQELLP